ncbi:hypothetical protein Taro_006527 [Colocasia esculenta]|uniref:Uncharacterized protein n=1 Tax=Colocasia esculenta TaxID=4460 RepID=A0A843TXM3_COLES|nr:hypothetical protein [Colocasia esculenta]
MLFTSMKFEPPEVTRWITKSLLHHLPGPVAQWRDYPRDVLDSLFQSFLATQEYQSRSAIATQNRAKMPEASLHTSGSITFGRHKKRMESYEQQLIERHGDDSSQHP